MQSQKIKSVQRSGLFVIEALTYTYVVYSDRPYKNTESKMIEQIQIPRGCAGKNESLFFAACREFVEETHSVPCGKCSIDLDGFDLYWYDNGTRWKYRIFVMFVEKIKPILGWFCLTANVGDREEKSVPNFLKKIYDANNGICNSRDIAATATAPASSPQKTNNKKSDVELPICRADEVNIYTIPRMFIRKDFHRIRSFKMSVNEYLTWMLKFQLHGYDENNNYIEFFNYVKNLLKADHCNLTKIVVNLHENYFENQTTNCVVKKSRKRKNKKKSNV